MEPSVPGNQIGLTREPSSVGRGSSWLPDTTKRLLPSRCNRSRVAGTAVGGSSATPRVGSVRSRSARTSSPWSRRSLNTSARSACRQASGSAVTYGVAATCNDRSTTRSRSARRRASASSTDRDKPTIVAGGRRTSTGTEGWSPTASARARRSRTVRSSSLVDPSAWRGGGPVTSNPRATIRTLSWGTVGKWTTGVMRRSSSVPPVPKSATASGWTMPWPLTRPVAGRASNSRETTPAAFRWSAIGRRIGSPTGPGSTPSPNSRSPFRSTASRNWSSRNVPSTSPLTRSSTVTWPPASTQGDWATRETLAEPDWAPAAPGRRTAAAIRHAATSKLGLWSVTGGHPPELLSRSRRSTARPSGRWLKPVLR